MSSALFNFSFYYDLPQAVKTSTVATYANDNSLSYRSDDIHQLNEALRKDVTTVIEWLKGNKLSLIVTKTRRNGYITKTKGKVFN